MTSLSPVLELQIIFISISIKYLALVSGDEDCSRISFGISNLRLTASESYKFQSNMNTKLDGSSQPRFKISCFLANKNAKSQCCHLQADEAQLSRVTMHLASRSHVSNCFLIIF